MYFIPNMNVNFSISISSLTSWVIESKLSIVACSLLGSKSAHGPSNIGHFVSTSDVLTNDILKGILSIFVFCTSISLFPLLQFLP